MLTQQPSDKLQAARTVVVMVMVVVVVVIAAVEVVVLVVVLDHNIICVTIHQDLKKPNLKTISYK